MRVEQRKDLENKIGVAIQRFIDELCERPVYGEVGEHLKLTIECWVGTEPNKPWDAPPDPNDEHSYVSLMIAQERKDTW